MKAKSFCDSDQDCSAEILAISPATYQDANATTLNQSVSSEAYSTQWRHNASGFEHNLEIPRRCGADTDSAPLDPLESPGSSSSPVQKIQICHRPSRQSYDENYHQYLPLEVDYTSASRKKNEHRQGNAKASIKYRARLNRKVETLEGSVQNLTHEVIELKQTLQFFLSQMSSVDEQRHVVVGYSARHCKY